MRKVLGLTLAMVLTLTLSAVAGEVTGDRSIALEDGVMLSVADSQISGLTPGDHVPAMLEIQGGKAIVSGFESRMIGSEPMSGLPIDAHQAE
jgi:hypothetical protein